MRDGLRDNRGIGVGTLVDRMDALQRFLDATDGHLPDDRLVAAHVLVERAGARLALSRHHTVVALAGATGSGKSSLFNALAQLELSPVGVRRPTTGLAHACVWGPLAEARMLLDWVGVLPRNRFVRESPLDADDESALRGLILLDLPDFDSVQRTHRLEADRLLDLVDLVVWVVDPQKYADRMVHENYLREFHRHRDVTLVVLNQADRVAALDLPRVLADLRRLLDADGLAEVPLLATAAVQPGGLTELRAALEKVVAERQAFLRRLAGDLTGVLDGLKDLVTDPKVEPRVDESTRVELAAALGTAAGVPAVVTATEQAYRHRAAGVAGWPVIRGLRRLRPDPLRRLHLPAGDETAGAESLVAATSVPEPTPAARAAVGMAVRAVADQAGGGLPAPWPAAVAAAARSRLADLPDALDRAVATTDLGMDRRPVWWRVVGGVQWLFTLAALAGLGWLAVGYALRVLGLPPLDYPKIGVVPLPTVLLVGGLLAGMLTALLVRPVVDLAARRAGRRAQRRLDRSVTKVGTEYVVAPVQEVLKSYGEAQAALEAARA